MHKTLAQIVLDFVGRLPEWHAQVVDAFEAAGWSWKQSVRRCVPDSSAVVKFVDMKLVGAAVRNVFVAQQPEE